MKGKAKYSAEFKEQALLKVFHRGTRTVRWVADELNMNVLTLKNWMREVNKTGGMAGRPKTSRPEDWSQEERLLALHQSHGLTGEALNAWCRERGLFAHHLAQWNANFCAVGAGRGRGENAQEIRELKQANVQLQRELNRKEKALAEAAALLVLQKKFHALFEDGAS